MNTTDDIDNPIKLAQWIIDYEFQSPQARYSNRIELAEKYTAMIDRYTKRKCLEARIEELKMTLLIDGVVLVLGTPLKGLEGSEGNIDPEMLKHRLSSLQQELEAMK